MILGDIFRRNRKLFSHKAAFVFDNGSTITFKQYDERVNCLINALVDLGIGKGQRLMVISSNNLPLMEIFGAAEKGGMIAVPVSPKLSQKEIQYIFDETEPSSLFVDLETARKLDSYLPELQARTEVFVMGDYPGTSLYEELVASGSDQEPDADVHEDDTVYLMFTSGTTGRPKGVMLNHKGQIASMNTVIVEMSLTANDSLMNPLPLNHIGGRAITLHFFARGCTSVLMEKYDTEKMLELMDREKVTNLLTVPSILGFLLDYPQLDHFNLTSLRTVYYSGSPMPVSLLEKALIFFGSIMFQSYGMTETGLTIAILHKEDHLKDEHGISKTMSCGRQAHMVEVRVINELGVDVEKEEVGEIIVRSDAIMQGYWKNPIATSETLRDGWIYTGDLATIDEEGFIYIVDRKKDMIISGGENIYAREVESILLSHPLVKEVAVIGVPDPVWGEAVKAIVVHDSNKLTEKELIEFCRQNMTSFKKPRSIDFVDSLPYNALGKVQKSILKDKYWKSQTRRVN